MNIYDKANELAAELNKCSEVVKLRKASEKIKDNKEDKDVLIEFRKLQVEAYSQQMKNGDVSDATKEKIKGIGSLISSNPSVNEYLQAEQEFSIMWNELIKILNDVIGIDFSFGEK
ncbi:YlbF family regulator [Clostridium fermenticellae]|uniref:YlbF family regulator n=1 Tax=Clostridium fermenticellae TaxID=2068654 RepID=A0A386H369_9CLOT|nr:YlbF family regulator [Clostridium fermenticellae]AYD40130.1 YlbF family regulator [Clostridium fermenticellae]